MRDYEFTVLLRLYLFGKKLQALLKKHNNDRLSQYIILRLASEHITSVSDISEILTIKISATMTKISDMEKKGLITRVFVQDRREHSIKITSKGKKMLLKIKEDISVQSHGHSIGLTKKEAETLVLLVDQIRLEKKI